jgi:uroporphyrinogen decarboxylase
MNHREMLFSLIEGPPAPGYVPAAFFLHFGPGYQDGPAAVARHREFFRATGMDFVKVQFEQKLPAHPINRPSDWATVPRLDESFFAPALGVVKGLVDELKAEAPVIVTLYSPFMCAGHVASQSGGLAAVTRHLEEDPDSARKGLETVTESLRAFTDACIRIGVDGFYHSTQGGESGRFSDRRLFTDYVKPFDLALMEEINRRCRFNILHICDYHRAEVGGYDDLAPFLDYPGHIVNCGLEIGGRTWSGAEVSRLFGRPFFGGMDRLGPLATGTEDDARQAASAALTDLQANGGGPYLLGADCTVPGDTPWPNLRAAIDEAHRSGDANSLLAR